MIAFELPFPPSLNHAWRRVGARTVLAKAQRDYRRNVAGVLAWGELRDDDAPMAPLTVPLAGRLAVALRFFEPNRIKRDLDNLPKAALDALTHAGLWRDDAQIDCLMLSRAGVSSDRPRVVVQVWRHPPNEMDNLLKEAA